MKFSKTSIVLLLIQLALVSSIAAKYLYQRPSCPRVWMRAAAYDPDMPMRGRYLSLRLTVDGCQSTLPNALHAIFPRNADGTTRKGGFHVNWQGPVRFRAKLKVEDNKLLAIRIPEADLTSKGEDVTACRIPPAMRCAWMSRWIFTSLSTPRTRRGSSLDRSCGSK